MFSTVPAGRKLLASVALSAALATLPLRLAADHPFAPVGWSQASADQGSGGGGGNSGSGGGGLGGGGNSGSGNSGSGGSGSGGSGGNSGSGGRGSGHVSSGHYDGANGARIEVEGDSIEITYPDGWKEELEGSRYELKDPYGRTVIERPATPADRTRMEAVL